MNKNSLLQTIVIMHCVLPFQVIGGGPIFVDANYSNTHQQQIDGSSGGLDKLEKGLSLLGSVVHNLQNQDALTVSTIKSLLGVADSRWKFGVTRVLENTVEATPQFAIPYLERFADLCHPRGASLIGLLNGQKKDNKKLTDFLAAIRHGMRYVDQDRTWSNYLLSMDAGDAARVDNKLKEYAPVLPAASAAVQAFNKVWKEQQKSDEQLVQECVMPESVVQPVSVSVKQASQEPESYMDRFSRYFFGFDFDHSENESYYHKNDERSYTLITQSDRPVALNKSFVGQCIYLNKNGILSRRAEGKALGVGLKEI